MKLYATITSERAEKGQGGNKEIRTRLNYEVEGKSWEETANEYIEITLKYNFGIPSLLVAFPPTWKWEKNDTFYHEGRVLVARYQLKANKEKGECVYVSEDSNVCITHNKDH